MSKYRRVLTLLTKTVFAPGQQHPSERGIHTIDTLY